MKNGIKKLQIKHLKKTLLFYSSLIFLDSAFEEATKKNEQSSLEEALSLLTDAIPENLKDVCSEEDADYERYYYSMQFVELVSNVELFLIEVIKLVVSHHPNKIGRQQVSIADVVELGDTRAVVEKACANYLNNLSYKKPNDYKNEFLKLLSANEDLLDDEWPTFIEMKARRDLGVHNDWCINDIYKRKIKEVGFTVPAGAKYMHPSKEYVLERIRFTSFLYDKICDYVREKYV